MKSLAETLYSCNRSPQVHGGELLPGWLPLTILLPFLLLFGQITESMIDWDLKQHLRWSKWPAVRTRFIIKMWQMVCISWYICTTRSLRARPRHLAEGLRELWLCPLSPSVKSGLWIVECKFLDIFLLKSGLRFFSSNGNPFLGVHQKQVIH